MQPVGIGIVGCGDISGIYLKNLTGLFREVAVVHLCDVVEERVREAAESYGIPRWSTRMEELFADPQVEIVLNLGRAYDHYGITKAALEAGKHVYSEKPLGVDFEEGKALAELAQEKGLLLGGAPDTFLGGSFQTCRRMIEAGAIGKPVGGSAFMVCHGHESWHPNPDYYYQRGGGPLLDMGPYYITVLANLFGRIKRVCGMTSRAFTQRTISSQPRFGEQIDVAVDTHVNGLLEFENGAIVNLLTTFDAYESKAPLIEIYGTEGTLQVPDPDCFSGELLLYRPEQGAYAPVPVMFPYLENSRGLGLADMAKALRTGRAPRAGVQQTLHVLEAMTAILDSGREHRFIELQTPYERPEIMKSTPMEGILD